MRMINIITLPSYIDSAPSVYKVTSLHDHTRGPFMFDKTKIITDNKIQKCIRKEVTFPFIK